MTLERRAAATDLLNEFCWRADTGAGDTIADLFVEDGTVVTPHFALAGRAQIHAWFSERAKPGARVARHLLTNLRFSERGDGGLLVTGYSLVTLQPSPDAATRVVIGTTTDELVFEGGQARFASRRLDVAIEGRLEIEGAGA